MTRLQRFREYMARMNPVVDPEQAIKDGLYVSRGGLDLVQRIELEPQSTNLLLGGIGSGKTTELLRARDELKDRLANLAEAVVYIDVSKHHDLAAQSMRGVLCAIAGLSLLFGVGTNDARDVVAARETFHRLVVGHTDWLAGSSVLGSQRLGRLNRYKTDQTHEAVFGADDIPGSHEGSSTQGWDFFRREVPGALVPPTQPIPEDLASLVPPLLALKEACMGKDGNVVFFFDSLDRLPDVARFREAVGDDLRVLKAAGIGVVVVGPVRFMAGVDRSISNLFDQTHFLSAVDPVKAEEKIFLEEILRKRASSLLREDCLELLAKASGGILRDLIALAKGAGSEAYAAGHDEISVEDVNRAIDVFGRDLAIGLDDKQISTLKNVKRGFVIRGEQELSLIETRRVVPYPGPRWAVHPALARLLDAITEAA